MSKGGQHEMRFTSYTVLALLLALALSGTVAFGQESASDGKAAESEKIVFEGSRAEAERFIGYHRSILLTPEQEAIKRQALEVIPAPCCSNFSAATCCCPCNLAKTIWGLSNFLIAMKGFGAGQVRDAVNTWIAAINPSGFPGDSCFTGGCGRPFEERGCGGMHESELLF
jgi:hypothetical protein